MKDILLTIDVGTGSTRAALLQKNGDILGFAQREYDQISPKAGWSEQPPSLWWQSVCACLQELTQSFADICSRIAAVGVCGQMHGLVLLNTRGELVTDKALLWNDKRSQPQVNAFLATEGQKWLAHLNNPPTAAWPAFKCRWWQENAPEIWQQVAKILMPKDYINFMLTGRYVTDYSEASCYFLMDSHTLQWSETMLRHFAICRDQLPEIALSCEVIGQLSASVAAQTGLPQGIPVVAGSADMAATLLGSGVLMPGIASDSTGTSTLLTVVSSHPLLNPSVNNLHLANPGWGGFTILDAGGDAVRWVRQILSHNQLSHHDLLAQAAQICAGAEGLIFLPYLTGERMASATNSRAQFFGLQRKHHQGHLFRAVLEGVAFAGLRNLNQLSKSGHRPDQMIASGGGARGLLWLQIKAAIYNLPIVRTLNQENGITGCGIVAGVGVGLYASFASGVEQTVRFAEPIYPDARLHDYYANGFALFETLYQQAVPLYDQLDKLSVPQIQ